MQRRKPIRYDNAWQAGYDRAAALNLPIVPGSHALEAGQEARQYLMQVHPQEFDAFTRGFAAQTQDAFFGHSVPSQR